MTLQEALDLLKLDFTATEKDVKAAFRKLALQYHPDHNLEDKANAEEKFKKYIKLKNTIVVKKL